MSHNGCKIAGRWGCQEFDKQFDIAWDKGEGGEQMKSARMKPRPACQTACAEGTFCGGEDGQ